MNENKTSDVTLLIAMIVFIAIISHLISTYSYYFFELWRWLRVGQLSIFSWIPDAVPFWGDTQLILSGLIDRDISDFDNELVNRVDSIYYPLFGWIPVYILFKISQKIGGRTEDVNQKLSMEGILHRYAKSFPFLKPYLDFDPSKMDDITFERDDKEKLKYLPALQPAEFAMLVPPLFLEKEAKVDSSFMAPIWSPEDGVGFDEGLAERSFKKQLGLHFTGTDNMTSTEKKVFNILVDRLTFNKADMQTLIKKMAVVICKNKGSFKGKIPYIYSELDLFNKLLDIYNGYVEYNNKSKKDKKNPDIIKNNKYINRLVYSKEMEAVLKNISGDRIMSEHAFTYCGLMSMLEKGREGGVIEPVTIQWVKLENRTLFFALNSVGKKVSFVESAGIFAHWLLELHIGRPVPTAEVSEAVIGLKTSLYIEEQNS